MAIEFVLMGSWNWSLDGWIVAAGVLCAVAAALLGNFLVLREMSMLGDAISHAVLPGLAAAFIISGSRNSWPMFLGAVIVGVLTAFFTEWIRRVGDVDEGASMGVVFTSLFALGLVMIVQAADHVDLDPSCVLYGAIELTPLEPRVSLLGWQVPPSIRTLAVVAAINLAFVILFFKELKISSFDPALATSSGLNARFIHYALMVLVAITAVASFETVGNILVVAMFVVPPAAAWMLTNRLSWMIVISVILAVVAAVVGHLAAITVPGWFGFESTTTAGMMAVVAGLILILTVLFAPEQGIVIGWLRQLRLSQQILGDDVIALLYRRQESRPAGLARASEERRPDFQFLRTKLFARPWMLRWVLWQTSRAGLIELKDQVYRLTGRGLDQAAQLVRSHRLWEQYLVTKAGLDSQRIHDRAEQLEHFTDRRLRQQLYDRTDAPVIDPHGSPIPPETGRQD